jgi:hypothetical protein
MGSDLHAMIQDITKSSSSNRPLLNHSMFVGDPYTLQYVIESYGL